MQSKEYRSLRARIGAHSLHAQYDVLETSRAGRLAFLERFYDEVDPRRQLEPAERERRAAHARRAYMTRLSLKAAKAREAKRAESADELSP